MNGLVSNFPKIPRSMCSGNFDPSHWIFIERVVTDVFVAWSHTISLSASLIAGTSSITSVGLIGCGTLIIMAVLIFLAGSRSINRIDFPNKLLRLESVSAAFDVSVLIIFLPVADLRFVMCKPLYSLARCTRTSVSLSHWFIKSIMNSFVVWVFVL